jgi:hypothetical protein
VSNIGMARRKTTGVIFKLPEYFARLTSKLVTTRKNPIINEPLSPKKIRAGKALYLRKPSKAPASVIE